MAFWSAHLALNLRVTGSILAVGDGVALGVNDDQALTVFLFARSAWVKKRSNLLTPPNKKTLLMLSREGFFCGTK